MAFMRPLPLTPAPSSDRLASNELGLGDKSSSRELGCNELSYFLPSRADGVNDMYLHLGFCAPNHIVTPSRLYAIWAIQRLRHPLLSARIIHGPDIACARYEYTQPDSVDQAVLAAQAECEIRTGSRDDLISDYLNGPRLLSPSRTSFLILARDPEQTDAYHLLLCAMHCIGDGMALHACANQILLLLGAASGVEELLTLVAHELGQGTTIPHPMEAGLPELKPGLKTAIAKVDEQLLSQKQIGGHSFSKAKGTSRKTIFPTVSFDPERTKRILSRCKSNGVSVSNAVFALCNIAWARMLAKRQDSSNPRYDLPSMMYTALNTRPWLNEASAAESFFKLCIGYFNVILPSFIPAADESLTRIFWHRARLAKHQSTKAVKSPFVAARTQLATRKRAEQAIKWAKIDDAAAERKINSETETGLPTPAASPQNEKEVKFPPASPTALGPIPDQPAPKPQVPSAALMGLSLLGNLDGIYKHAAYGELKLHTLTTGSRQRAGAMLLFSYTFVGKLWLCFGYDENGFPKGVVEEFWEHVLHGVDEFLGS